MDEEKCIKCGMPVGEATKCVCTTEPNTKCVHCCECDEGCECNCKEKSAEQQ